ncbi:acetyl- carboxylase, putative [Babesia ovata]|uniref:Acetyl-carboxylase, putative n=1 Tax=Babesia ovata TaxID=189622 RepID=A0A2H6KBI0_9APIC|nr:acetyl- carboxylase, putative [Babesia ovata]GBE60319.1 acetyl- carboxylase, putative [Babesia ovata]
MITCSCSFENPSGSYKYPLESLRFLGGILRNVAAAANDASLAGDAHSESVLQHGGGKVHSSISCCFRPDVGASPFVPLPSQRAIERIPQPAVLSEHVPYLTSSNSNVPRRLTEGWKRIPPL